MNQRYPQSRHTPHGGSEKPTQRKVPACKRAEGGLGQWLPVATADHVCPLPRLSPGACYLSLVSSPPPLVPRVPDPELVPRGVSVGRAVPTFFCQAAQTPAPELRSFDCYTPKKALYGIFRAAFNSRCSTLHSSPWDSAPAGSRHPHSQRRTQGAAEPSRSADLA